MRELTVDELVLVCGGWGGDTDGQGGPKTETDVWCCYDGDPEAGVPGYCEVDGSVLDS